MYADATEQFQSRDRTPRKPSHARVCGVPGEKKCTKCLLRQTLPSEALPSLLSRAALGLLGSSPTTITHPMFLKRVHLLLSEHTNCWVFWHVDDLSYAPSRPTLPRESPHSAEHRSVSTQRLGTHLQFPRRAAVQAGYLRVSGVRLFET